MIYMTQRAASLWQLSFSARRIARIGGLAGGGVSVGNMRRNAAAIAAAASNQKASAQGAAEETASSWARAERSEGRHESERMKGNINMKEKYHGEKI